MAEHQIVDYQPSDQEDLLQFFHMVFVAIGFDFDLNSKDEDLRNIASVYQSRGGLFLLARRRETLIGTIALRQITDSLCELTRFYVIPEHQRRGVGTSLLRSVLDHAKAGRWNCIRLDTTRRLTSAISLFQKHGFVETGRHNDHPFAEVFMELRMD